ncbi:MULTISPECIES: DUF3916 domain-containing protein [Ruminococcus]|uniref:DUF3916 domain-containing protein n=1 Tax=Ruminococcus TaxID=1263 RepID=UPI000682B781|nr:MULTISPECIES: DUF3916 domain-containing protein [Ruminococcus]MBO5559627.1 DUF3916 domain-containing protein [Ruminococcus sp.]MCC3352757.1 DUF3916 domain-containing protein [Ruminococcus albus 8]
MYYGKSRGQRRKFKRLLENIAEIEPYQDIDEINEWGFEHFHVPGSVWLDMPKTSSKIKTLFCKAWIRKTEEILKAKPDGLKFCKVVCFLCIPDLFCSQIIIFYGRKYYDSFWDRHNEYQDWSRITNGSSLAKERNIHTDLKEAGFKETIHDEDETYNSYLWFYGELSDNI